MPGAVPARIDEPVGPLVRPGHDGIFRVWASDPRRVLVQTRSPREAAAVAAAALAEGCGPAVTE
ncbi:DUF6193 family natural product biosynthesis protein [Streptacidiphilus melanogenes]|uniref:DUF6193 family natural product biosynthesis protein n=1 Tax=Streptacidiphilus melanogenes TaxID=411235 RepID=UPI0005A9DF03